MKSLDLLVQPSEFSAARAESLVKNSRYLDVTTSETNGYIWCELKPDAPVCFSPDLVEELQNLQQYIVSSANTDNSFAYQVISSNIPGVFSMGGDLDYFLHLINKQDVKGLTEYAYSTVDLVHSMAVGHKQNLLTIAAIDGKAYGGGFECALAADYIIATEDSFFAFPEVMFNLIPGMGAYQLLCRRVSMDMAKKIIMSGKVYSAQEMLELGVIDSVVKADEINDSIAAYMHSLRGKQNSMSAMREIFEVSSPISKDELYKVADIWVNHALQLTEKDKKLMKLFAQKQAKIFKLSEESAPLQSVTSH